MANSTTPKANATKRHAHRHGLHNRIRLFAMMALLLLVGLTYAGYIAYGEQANEAPPLDGESRTAIGAPPPIPDENATAQPDTLGDSGGTTH
jgi:hypothetical protein